MATESDEERRGHRDVLTAAAFDALPAQVAVLDADGAILETNRSWAEFGAENDLQGDAEMVGENYLQVCDASDGEEAATAADGIRSVLAGEVDAFSFEYPCHSPGTERWFTMRAIRLPEYREPHVLVMHTDITDRKRAELRVALRNERLNTVADVLSHDLRNPLSVVLARAEYLTEATSLDDAEGVTEQAESIVSSARRINDIIDDALLVARESPSVTLETVDLDDVARDAWSHVEAADARLVVRETATLRVDRSLLSQLFENAFRNALEHGGDGVTVTVSATDDGFAVADDGPGIPADERDRVFEPGYTTNAAGGGTGMGLTIVQTIADAHGWTVRVATDEADGDSNEQSGTDETAASAGARFVFDGVTVVGQSA